MANAYSIQRNRQGWIDPTDQDFTLKALQFKQQKYDSNRAKVDAVIDKYKSLQLARGVDKDYLNERLSHLVNTANDLGGDFSSNAITSTVTNYIDQTLDENVMTAVQQTQKIQAYNAEVAKIKEKSPEKWNALNEAFGMSPANDYLKSTKIGDTIKGPLVYHNYQDVEGEVNKWLTDIQHKSKDGVFEYLDGNGLKKTITINGKSYEELRELALGFMGSRYDQQFRINAWGNTGGFKNVDSIAENTIKQYDDLISKQQIALADVNSKLTGSLSEEDKNNLHAEKQMIERNLAINKQMREGFANNPQGALIHLEKMKVADGSATALANLQTKSIKYSKDDYFFAKANLDLEYQKFRHTVEIDYAKLAAQKEKDAKEKAEKTGLFIIENDMEIPTEEALNSNIKEAILKYDNDENYHIENLNVSKTISDLAKGVKNGYYSDEQISQAKALVANVEAKLGTKFNYNDKVHAEALVREYVDGERYSKLNTLYDSRNKSKTLAKADSFRRLSERDGYRRDFEEMREEAQRVAQAEGKKHWQDTSVARNWATQRIQRTARTSWSVAIESDQAAARITALIDPSHQNAAEMSSLVKKGQSFVVKPKEDGSGYELIARVNSANKDVLSNATQTITVDVSHHRMRQVMPEVDMKSHNREKYNFSTMGMRPITSKRITYEAKNSEEANYLKSTVAKDSPELAPFIELDTARAALKSGFVGRGYSKEFEQQMSNVVDSVVRDDNRYVVQFNADAGYVGQNGVGKIAIVDRTTGKEIMNKIVYGEEFSKIIDLNHYAPQVLKTMIIRDEINSILNNSRTGNLELTEGIKALM